MKGGNCGPPEWLYSPVRMGNSSKKKFHKLLVKLGTISPAAHFFNCLHNGRSQTVAAIICGLSSGKRFVKLREVL